jgi:mannose-1-phosphate guanylyltransferase
MKAMILAAGLGTRLRPVTERYAKPAVPFLNVPLLYYSIALLESAGVDELVINSHYKPEQIRALAERIPGFRGRTVVTHEAGKDPLGSGGGIWNAREHLRAKQGAGGDSGAGMALAGNDPQVSPRHDFLLANGDEVILPKDPQIMHKLCQEHAAHNALATILVMRHPLVGTQFGGVWASSDGRVRGFGKDPKAFGPGCEGFHYIGLQILNERVFEYLPEGESNILYDALAKAIAAGETVRVVVSEFSWFETGNIRDFVHASGECLALLAQSRTTSPETSFLHDLIHRFTPESRLVRGDGQAAAAADNGDQPTLLLEHQTSFVDPGAKVRGFAVLGPGASLGAEARVENVVVLPNARVDDEAPRSADMILD